MMALGSLKRYSILKEAQRGSAICGNNDGQEKPAVQRHRWHTAAADFGIGSTGSLTLLPRAAAWRSLPSRLCLLRLLGFPALLLLAPASLLPTALLQPLAVHVDRSGELVNGGTERRLALAAATTRARGCAGPVWEGGRRSSWLLRK